MMHSATHVCILFARFPQPGKAKTRLIPALGSEGAAQAQRLMTEFILTRLRAWRLQSPQHAIHIYYTGKTPQAWRDWLGRDIPLFAQQGRTLGEKMAHALRHTLARGAQKAVLMGTDAPEMDVPLWQDAFHRLETHDAVAGPTADGGYYLIGQRRFIPELFEQIDWSTDRVWAQTQARARVVCALAVLPQLTDVDTPRELPVWERVKHAEGPKTWSVVIPVVNEAATLGPVLARIQASPVKDIWVVDGGSTDDTCTVAERAGVQVRHSPPGRALQMNLGAEHARGDYILFVHGDTLLPDGFWISALEALSRPGVVAGAFSLGIASKKMRFRPVEQWTNWRSRVLGWPYGDQGLFMARTRWLAVKGFPARPIMEDVGMVETLRNLGNVVTTTAAVRTSSRRWDRWGIAKTVWRHQIVWLRYWLKHDLEQIAAGYRRH